MREPVWPSVQSIVEFNQEVVASTGEPHGVINEVGLASAVARPRNAWDYAGERDLLVMAGKLLMGIARNHPFRQGNKRSALVAAIAFLEANGVEVLDIYDATEEIAELIEQTIVERTDDVFPDRFRRFVNGPTLFDSEA